MLLLWFRRRLTMMVWPALGMTLACPLFSSPCQAQSDSATAGAIVGMDIARTWSDAKKFASTPAHWSPADWTVVGAVLGGALLLGTADHSARDLAQRNQSTDSDHLFEIGRQYGREVYGLAIAGGCYVGGLASRNSGLRKTGVAVFESIAFAGVTTTVFKALLGRSRPYLEEGSTHFAGPTLNDDRSSLPSGHATVAFALSSALAGRIGNTVATIGLYSLATLTAASRVYHDEHWLTDSFLGAAIGTASGFAALRFQDDAMDEPSLTLFPTTKGIGVALRF
jgi:membrane-associated phospholipid phosphatase